MKILKLRRISAKEELEKQLKDGTKPTRLSAEAAKGKGFKKINGKFREPLTTTDIKKIKRQVDNLEFKLL